ncbi:hypothetical protein Efla_004739 [Eimeria flavescens]
MERYWTRLKDLVHSHHLPVHQPMKRVGNETEGGKGGSKMQEDGEGEGGAAEGDFVKPGGSAVKKSLRGSLILL